MVARAQRILAIGWLVLVIGWIGFWWSRSTATAMVGLLVLVFAHVVCLAVEFCVGWWIGKRDAVPRPSPCMFVRAWLAETAAAPRVFAWLQPFRWYAVPDHLPERTGRGWSTASFATEHSGLPGSVNCAQLTGLSLPWPLLA